MYASRSGSTSTLSRLSVAPESLRYIVWPPETGSEGCAEFKPCRPSVVLGLVMDTSRRGICARLRPDVPVSAPDTLEDDMRSRCDCHQTGRYRRKNGRKVGKQAQMIPTLVSTEPMHAGQHDSEKSSQGSSLHVAAPVLSQVISFDFAMT